jgi:NADPH:quinone reductase-like Zn-dependent oxidoreductase
MRASIRYQYGDPSVLSVENREKPAPKPNEILVKVYATTINRTDIGVLTGAPFVFRFFTGLPKPRHQITGTDFAGQVESVGSAVTKFKVGDRVWGFLDHGLPTHAEYCTLPESGNIAFVPNNWDYQQIVACAEGAHYARNFINKVTLQAGQKAMVYGATGAIGSALVQLLKYYGLYVTAVCPTKQVDLIRTLGPDKVVDYQTQDFTKDTERYDYVFDAVGKSSFGVCKPLLLPKGIYISSELGPNNENLYLPLTTLFSKGQKVIFPMPTDIKASLQLMLEVIEKGQFKPLIDRVYPLDDVAEAFRYVMTGQKIGNVVIEVSAKPS